MKTIEIIKVRTGNNHSKAATGLLRQLSADIEETVRNQAVQLYQSTSITGDFAYFLTWDEGLAEAEESSLGVKIRKSLEPLGLVDHTIWQIMEPASDPSAPRHNE
jgi:hypothetical protein